MKKITVTTSWDDGHILDLKIVDLLKKYKLKGTFYISPKNREFPKSQLLTNKQVKKLSEDFEIGAHTMTHPLLANDLETKFFKIITKIVKTLEGKKYSISPSISVKEAKREIEESKLYLEKVIDKKIVSFCYPAGSNNKKIQSIVKKAGFKYARTVKRHKFKKVRNLFASPTSLHAYRQYQDILKIAHFSKWNPVAFVKNLDWEILAKRMFDSLKPGEVFHLFGHSWIINEKKEWDKLERVFQYISKRKNVRYVENRMLAK